jgi:lipopolysaccharide/colanic/teichoic acid biosynthesis glycosyltransferase
MGISQSKIVPLTERNTGAASVPKPAFSFSADAARQNPALEEDVFHSMLTLERRRAERSRQPFVLMLLDASERNGSSARILSRAIDAVALPTRETDLIGWYKKGAILGIIFTEVTIDEKIAIPEILRRKIAAALSENLGAKEAEKIAISVHLFPEDWSQGQSSGVVDSKLYSNLRRQVPGKRISLGVKRAIDILGSGALLLLMSPILAAIALAIKLTSEGPVLFEQERLGRFGARFKCLKFRTMYTNCNPKIHQDYIQEFISGKSESTKQDSVEPVVYKITNDPRITAVGRFLRRTSLDELPQFWNVLRNDMSLVGPRPPVPYEFEIYDIWHRRRVLEVKPGITGLWQVSGRSRTRFDDMVRLDLRYCQSWSLWLDIKILFATPFAVFSGDGAY